MHDKLKRSGPLSNSEVPPGLLARSRKLRTVLSHAGGTGRPILYNAAAEFPGVGPTSSPQGDHRWITNPARTGRAL
jgi:hypothetical protein